MRRCLSLVVVLSAGVTAQAQSWTALGPTPFAGQTSPSFNVSGAVQNILVNPTTSSTWLVGTVNGGVWRTTNSGGAWTPLTDNVGSMSIGSLAYDPTSNGNTIIAGFGRRSSLSFIGGNRLGMTYSLNGGNTWTNITNLPGGPDIWGVAARNLGVGTGTIVAAVNEADVYTYANIGIWRSTNGGANWTKISTGTGATTGLQDMNVYGLFENNTVSTQLFTASRFVANGNEGIFRSNDTGATWTRLDTTNATFNNAILNAANVKVVAQGTFAYAAIIGSGGTLNSVWRSDNSGDTWSLIPNTPAANPGGQGWVHTGLHIDPTDPGNRVWLTGDATQTSPFTGRIFRLDNGAGGTWTTLFNNTTNAPHADGRAVHILPNGTLLHGGDGGLAQLPTATGTFGTWASANGTGTSGLQTLEIHSIAFDPVNSRAFGGTQDNGTTSQNSAGTGWFSMSGGDGGQVAVVRNPANSAQSLRYSSFQFLGSLAKRTFTAAGAQTGGTVFPALNIVGGGTVYGDGTRQFYGPIATNRADGNRLYIGTNSLYESLDQGATVTNLRNFGTAVNVITAGGFTGTTARPNVLYVGASNQVWVRGETGALAQATAYPGGTVVDIALLSTDWQKAAVADQTNTRVYRTTNAGVAFTNITGNLLTANPRFGTLRAVEAVPLAGGDGREIYFAGGSDGVYYTTTDALGTWQQLGTNLPDTIIMDLDYDPDTDTLIVAAFGRGAWIIDDISTLFPIPEPATVLLAAAPVLGLASLLRRRRSQNKSIGRD